MKEILHKFLSKENYLICGTLLIAFCLFWFMFPLYTFDSAWYLSYLDFFAGNKSFSEWNAIRGFAFPLILWIAHLIRAGSWGVEIVLCFFYMLFGLYLFKILKLVKACRNKLITIYDCIFVFLFALMSPILWGYFHLVLTEGICVSLLTVYCYYAISFYVTRKEHNTPLWKYALFLIFTCIMTILFWFLKQSFVVNTIFVAAILEILSWIDKLTIKKVLYSLTLVVCIAVSYKSSSFVWNKTVGADYTRFFSNCFNRVRYFVPEQLYSGGTISVWNDDWELMDSFEYTYENNYQGTLKYLGTCFMKYPGRVLMGYWDNYMLMADLYQHPYVDIIGVHSAFGPVVRDQIWETLSGRVEANLNIAQEHPGLIKNNLLRTYDAQSSLKVSSEILANGGNSITFLEDYTNVNRPNFVTKFLGSQIFWTFSTVIYALLLVMAPFILIVCFILYLKRKSSILGTCTALSFYSFLFIMIHVVEGACVDRYAVPAYGAMLALFVIVLSAFVDKLLDYVKQRESQAPQND